MNTWRLIAVAVIAGLATGAWMSREPLASAAAIQREQSHLDELARLRTRVNALEFRLDGRIDALSTAVRENARGAR